MFLYGASGHAKVIIDILENRKIVIDGLFDDNGAIMNLLGYPVYPATGIKGPLIISIGDNRVRRKIASSLHVEFGQIAHLSAIISDHAGVDEGTVIMQGAIIQSSSTIGKHCIINTGASVDHDCLVMDFVHISPHSTLCGNVRIGEGSWVGAGAVILPGIKVGRWCIIGAGSVVTKDIPDYSLAVGNRCKILKNLKHE